MLILLKYTSPQNVKLQKEKTDKMFREMVLSEDRRLCGGPPMAAMPWIGALHHGSSEVGMYLSSLVLQDEDPRSGAAMHSPEKEYLRSRIASAGSVLAAIGYCCGRSAESDITLPDGEPPLVDVVLAAGLGNLAIPPVSSPNPEGALKEVLSEKSLAEKELKEAFALLSKEFTSQSVASRLSAPSSY